MKLPGRLWVTKLQSKEIPAEASSESLGNAYQRRLTIQRMGGLPAARPPN